MAHPAHHPARAIPVDRSRRTAVLAVALAVTLVCNGCLAGIIGGLLPLLLNGSGGSTNSAPVISIGAISRTSGQVAVPITVVDADADNVTLTVEFDAGSGYMPGTATPGSVTGSLNGTAAVLNWNAPVDLGSTAWVGGVLIRITPADGTTTGTPVTSDPFDFGNDAPVLTAVSVDTDAQNKVSGNAVVRFTVADTSADTISVKTFEYSLLGDFSDAVSVPLTTGAGANFPSGSLSNLPSTSGGTNHSFTWNSYLTAPVSAAGAKVRITLRDQGALDSTTEESPAFDLANSTFVEIGAIARTSGVVSVPLTVYNSASLMVTLSVEYDIGGGFVATANTTPAQIPGTPGGNAGVLMWDAPTDLGSTAFVSGVVLRISPDDGVAPGPQEVSDPFDFGNDPPVVQTLGVDGNPVSGNVVVRFTISDNSADSVSLADFQYSLLGDFSDAVSVPLTTGGAGNFPSGTLTGLPTTAGGIEHAITWNSLLTADFAQTGAKIRLRVTDVPGLTSAYTPSAGFDLANGDPHPPIAQIIAVKRADPGGLRTGVVLIDYRVIDDDADQIDVKVEYSIDDKQSWLPCSEYPSARSEGRYDLASSPSGVRHRFVWDAESDLGGETPSVHFRVSPAAIDGIGLEAETSIDIAVGAPGGVEAFSPLQDIAVGNAPIHLAAADLDRNGTIDLAVVLNGGNAVRILPGKGDGTFTTGATVAVGSGPLAVAIGDINNDNVPDLAVSNFNDDTISLLIGDGEGGFSSGGTLATGDQPRHVLLADFNTDGKLDIACTEGNATNLMVRLGNGDGTFGSATANATANSPRQVIAADVNNDGNLDLLIACNTGNRVRTLLGVGNGTFTSAGDTNVANQPTSLTAGYFNGDSNIDLAVVSTRFNNQQIQILTGNGNGTFSASALPLSGGDEPIWIVAGDYNLDGTHDLVVVNATANNLGVLTGNTDGSFNTAVTTALRTVPTCIAVADFNDDGVMDLAIANNGAAENDVSIMIGRRSTTGWYRTLTGADVVGATTLPAGNDLFGAARVHRIGLRRFHGSGDDAPDDARSGARGTSHSFHNLLRLSGASPVPAVMERLTDAWTFSGDLRLHRQSDGGPVDTGYRIHPVSRFGNRTTPGSITDFTRAGLDLSDASLANQRGIIVELPIVGTRTDGQITTQLGAGKIHVWMRVTDQLRANTVAADPATAEPDAALFLPRFDPGAGFRDVYAERYTWVKVAAAASNDLNNGSGSRFAIDLTPGNRRVRVLTDRGGTIQAYYQP